MKKLKLRAIMANFQNCMMFIETELELAKMDNQNILKTLTACEELIVNIIKYAYPKGDGELEIVFEEQEDLVAITICDSGKAFNPLQKPDFETTSSLEDREVGGLGILMMKKLMDDITYEYQNGQNRLRIIKLKTKL